MTWEGELRRLSVRDDEGLRRGELDQTLEALFAAVARAAEAAEGQLDAAARAVAVHEDLARAHGTADAGGAHGVAGPHASGKPEGRAVRQPDRLRFVIEGCRH